MESAEAKFCLRKLNQSNKRINKNFGTLISRQHSVPNGRPGLMVEDKERRIYEIVNVAVPANHRIKTKIWKNTKTLARQGKVVFITHGPLVTETKHYN